MIDEPYITFEDFCESSRSILLHRTRSELHRFGMNQHANEVLQDVIMKHYQLLKARVLETPPDRLRAFFAAVIRHHVRDLRRHKSIDDSVDVIHLRTICSFHYSYQLKNHARSLGVRFIAWTKAGCAAVKATDLYRQMMSLMTVGKIASSLPAVWLFDVLETQGREKYISVRFS